MRYSQDFIDKVREANDIVEIIGQYTELKGNNRLMGRCPFPDHSDKSPSFSVTEDKQFYFCYGCKKGGNLFNFLETFNAMSFPEAVEFLARRANIPLPEKEERAKNPNAPSRDEKDLMLKINKAAAVFFHQQLKAQPIESPVQKYLEKRGLGAEIVEKFRLGITLEDWQGLARHLESRKVPLQYAEKLGLLKPKKNPGVATGANLYFDLFRERLMFPIFSPTGDVIGFGGRTLGDALPKYVNSSDSTVFHKGKIFYGLHETGKFIRAQDEAIVVEGYMDAISLYAAGIKNVIAILGTAFTPEHAKLIKRYTLNVKMLLDGDEAGISGAERSLPILLEAGLMPKGFLLPDKMDPDDFVKANGADTLRTEIDRAPELFSLLLRRRWLVNYHGSASDKVRVIEEAASCIRGMQNRQLFDLYALELAQELDVSQGWVQKSLTQIISRPTGRTTGPVGSQSGGSDANKPAQDANDDELARALPLEEEEKPKLISLQNVPKEEAFVLSLLLYNEGLMSDLVAAGEREVIEILSHEGVKTVLERAVQMFRAEPNRFANIAATLASVVDRPAVLAFSLPLMPADAPEGSDKRLIADYLGAIRNRHLKNHAKEITQRLRDNPNAKDLEEFMNVQRSRLSTVRDDS